jgi:hypothetical protein
MNYTEFIQTDLHKYLYIRLLKSLGSEGAIDVIHRIYTAIECDNDRDYMNYIIRKTQAEGYLYESFDLYGAFTFDSTREGFHYWHLVSILLSNN